MKKLGLALLAILLMAGAWVMISQQHRRQKMYREISALKEGYLGLAMYRSDRGQFPAQLSDLVPDYLSEEAHQKLASCVYSPQTPERLLARRGAVVHADGSGRIEPEA